MRMHNLLWIAAFVVVCGTATTLIKTIDRTVFGSRDVARHVVDSNAPVTALPPAIADGSAQKPPRATSASDQHWQALKLLSEAKVAHREALGCVEQWKIEIEPVLNGESGAAVAVNHDLVEKLAFVLAMSQTSESELDSLGEQIKLLQDRVASAAAETPAKLLSAREMYEIRELQTKASLAARDWSAKINHANAIVLKANRDAQPIVEPTLRESLEQIQTEQTLAGLDENIAAADELEDASNTASTSSEADEEQQDALSAEVKSALAPFLEPRRIQPSLAGRMSIKFLRTSEEIPMSLGRLMSIGALHDSVLGLQKLAEVGGNRKLPEPKWSIPSQPNSWSEDDEEFLVKAQAMLRDYANTLVAEGLLSP